MFPILTNTYFSGAGLMDIGLQAGGLSLQQSFEIDALCCETMRWNFAHEVVQCDITKKLVQAEKECHVMVATYPCTKYSPIALLAIRKMQMAPIVAPTTAAAPPRTAPNRMPPVTVR